MHCTLKSCVGFEGLSSLTGIRINKPLSLQPQHKGRKRPQRQIPGRAVTPKGYCRHTGVLGKPKAVLKSTEGLNSPKSPLLPAFTSGLGAPGQRGILDQTHRARGTGPAQGCPVSSPRHRGLCTRAVSSLIQIIIFAISKVPADHKRCSVTCKGRQRSAAPRLRTPPSILSLIASTLELNQQFILGYRP